MIIRVKNKDFYNWYFNTDIKTLDESEIQSLMTEHNTGIFDNDDEYKSAAHWLYENKEEEQFVCIQEIEKEEWEILRMIPKYYSAEYRNYCIFININGNEISLWTNKNPESIINPNFKIQVIAKCVLE